MNIIKNGHASELHAVTVIEFGADLWPFAGEDLRLGRHVKYWDGDKIVERAAITAGGYFLEQGSYLAVMSNGDLVVVDADDDRETFMARFG